VTKSARNRSGNLLGLGRVLCVKPESADTGEKGGDFQFVSEKDGEIKRTVNLATSLVALAQ